MYKNNLHIAITINETLEKLRAENAYNIEKDLVASINAPVLYCFTQWVIKSAQNDGIKRLYFLARDGYFLHFFAKKIVEKYNLDIECKYLYCSRHSLRLPSYNVLCKDETLSILTALSISLSPYIIMKRMSATEIERKMIYNDIGFNFEEEQILMPKVKYYNFINQLLKSELFYQTAIKHSLSSYNNCIEYLRQEGLFDNVKYAFVDTGWTGSIQRSLRLLLESAGHVETPHGYYFGLFSKSLVKADGIYESFLFNPNSKICNIIKFNNNLLECISIAPHGMTLDYEQKKDSYVPVFKKNNSSVDFELHFDIMKLFIEYALKNNLFNNVSELDSIFFVKKVLLQLMYHPSKQQAVVFSQYDFSDEQHESYLYKLAIPLNKQQKKSFLLFNRYFNRFFHKNRHSMPNLFWAYGSIAISEKIKFKSFYRLNILLWDFFRHLNIRISRKLKGSNG